MGGGGSGSVGGGRCVGSIGSRRPSRRLFFLGSGGGGGGGRWGRPGRRSIRLPRRRFRLPSGGGGRCPFRLGCGGFGCGCWSATSAKIPRPIKDSRGFRGEEIKQTPREVKTAIRASRALGRHQRHDASEESWPRTSSMIVAWVVLPLYVMVIVWKQ